MKMKKFFKQLIATALMIAILSGIQVNKTTAKADYSPVNMYYCDDIINWRGYIEFKVYIQVDAGSASNKQVYAHYNAGNGVWKDKAASYITTINGNKEIWEATISGREISDEYAIKYIGDGITYWDNNNGNNYTSDDILGVANVEAIRMSYQSPQNYKICAAVKNIGFEKKVIVRYTQDNWATYQDVALSYDNTYNSIYNNIIINKNYEYWSVNLNLDENKMDNFYFCIKYEVNGQTYWDNNFGRNYDKSFYRPL